MTLIDVACVGLILFLNHNKFSFRRYFLEYYDLPKATLSTIIYLLKCLSFTKQAIIT